MVKMLEVTFPDGRVRNYHSLEFITLVNFACVVCDSLCVFVGSLDCCEHRYAFKHFMKCGHDFNYNFVEHAYSEDMKLEVKFNFVNFG